jgi:hypothetical protein
VIACGAATSNRPQVIEVRQRPGNDKKTHGKHQSTGNWDEIRRDQASADQRGEEAGETETCREHPSRGSTTGCDARSHDRAVQRVKAQSAKGPHDERNECGGEAAQHVIRCGVADQCRVDTEVPERCVRSRPPHVVQKGGQERGLRCDASELA